MLQIPRFTQRLALAAAFALTASLLPAQQDPHAGHQHGAQTAPATRPATVAATETSPATAPATQPAEAEKLIGDLYPLDICIVTGMKLGSMGDPIVLLHEGREIRLCCAGCINKFKTEADNYLEKIDGKIIEQQSEDYPLTTCPMCGQEIHPEGEVTNHVAFNRLIKFDQPACENHFAEDPAEFLKKVDAMMIAALKDSYPTDKCVVSGEGLDEMGGPVDLIFAGKLVRLCCKGCVAEFNKNPHAHLAKIYGEAKDEAQEGQTHDHSTHEGHNH